MSYDCATALYNVSFLFNGISQGSVEIVAHGDSNVAKKQLQNRLAWGAAKGQDLKLEVLEEYTVKKDFVSATLSNCGY